mgnify:CR=1 FL=1
MRKITKNNITNEVSKAINTTIKYLNTYNTTWNVEIMEFPNKYNIILKTDNVCFDLENIPDNPSAPKPNINLVNMMIFYILKI